MTLIFSGNDYKYELEGVMKLFIPATLFTHVFLTALIQRTIMCSLRKG